MNTGTQEIMSVAKTIQERMTLIKFNMMGIFLISTSLLVYWLATHPSASNSPSQEILFDQSNQSLIFQTSFVVAKRLEKQKTDSLNPRAAGKTWHREAGIKEKIYLLFFQIF